MKVLLTGNLGFVGSVLEQKLIKTNCYVITCDVGFYHNTTVRQRQHSTSLMKDIRDLTKNDLKGCSTIFHLAALSNDPLGIINPSITYDINSLATIRLANLAKKTGIERFVFSSSCSVYGQSNEIVDEKSKVNPITTYSKSKVKAERKLLELTSKNFAVTILRTATAYGPSLSPRFDLVVNNLVGSAVSSGKIKLLSDGSAWRPIIHVEDMIDAFMLISNSKITEINGEIFNVGSNDDNYTINTIAKKIKEEIPNTKIVYAKNANKDRRSYKVNFDKIKSKLGYTTKWNLETGIKQMYKKLKEKKITKSDFLSMKFYRAKYLKWLLETGILDVDLRFKKES